MNLDGKLAEGSANRESKLWRVKMKNKFIYVATVALMANGLMFAHTLGDLPASTEVGQQSGSVVVSGCMLPGAMGSQQSQNAGASPKGQLPGIGVQSDQPGSASSTSMLLPGTDLSATPLLSERLSRL
jgi:hypothetical protein